MNFKKTLPVLAAAALALGAAAAQAQTIKIGFISTYSGPGAAHQPESISPANDGLFTSGTLGRYSRTLKSVMESHEVKPAEVAAD